MPRFAAVAAFAATAAVWFAGASAAAAAGPCSRDTFAIAGSSLTVELCDLGLKAGTGHLSERLTVRGRPPLERETTYQRLAASGTARTSDDVPLAPLGIAKTLHVTAAIAANGVRLEHALLVPGAAVLK